MTRQERRARARAEGIGDEFDRAKFADTFAKHPLTAENLIGFIMNNIDERKYGCSAAAATHIVFSHVVLKAVMEMGKAYARVREGDARTWDAYAAGMRALLNVFSAVCYRPVKDPLPYIDRQKLLVQWAAALPDADVRNACLAFAGLGETEPASALYFGNTVNASVPGSAPVPEPTQGREGKNDEQQ